ncbi:MAG TPA: glycosyltransferase family 39 protein [Oculatellaceae cyanobacterium]
MYFDLRRPTKWNERDWLLLALLSLAAIFAFLAGLNSFGILDPSDGYYSEGAREMFASGDWLIPHLNSVWFFDKPIMNYWLIAGCFKLFGVSEFVSRLPAAFCGAAIVPSLYAFARQFLRRRAALLSAVALLASPMWLIMGHMSLTDMPLSFFTWVALFNLFVAHERNKPNLLWIGYAALAGGLLTKGPLALFLVAMNFGLYLLLRRPTLPNIWAMIIKLRVVPGLLLTLGLALPWYLSVNSATHGVFFQEFFLNQNINRAMGTVDHRAGFWYYIPAVLGAAFPWNLFFLSWPKSWFRPWLQYIKGRDISLRARVTAFSVTTVCATLLFFSLLPTKLVTYVLPVLPGMALLAGVNLDERLRLLNRKSISSVLIALVVLLVGAAAATTLSLALGKSVQVAPFGLKTQALLQDLAVSTDSSVRVFLAVTTALLSLAGLCLLMGSALKRRKIAYNLFVVVTAIAVVLSVPGGIVLGYQQKCRDMQALVLYAKNQRLNLTMLGHRNPSAMFYMQEPVKFVAGNRDLLLFLRKSAEHGRKETFLVHRIDFDGLRKEGVPVSVIEERGDWILGRSQ